MFSLNQETRKCYCCEKPLRGRTDKKFCDDNCRNQFNNQRKVNNQAIVRKINSVLSRNRRILENFLPQGNQPVKVQREKFLMQGFQFRYCTHVFVNQKGAAYRYCYDYGYLDLDAEHCLVVKEKEETYERSGG
jgi:hypothetical protein